MTSWSPNNKPKRLSRNFLEMRAAILGRLSPEALRCVAAIFERRMDSGKDKRKVPTPCSRCFCGDRNVRSARPNLTCYLIIGRREGRVGSKRKMDRPCE